MFLTFEFGCPRSYSQLRSCNRPTSALDPPWHARTAWSRDSRLKPIVCVLGLQGTAQKPTQYKLEYSSLQSQSLQQLVYTKKINVNFYSSSLFHVCLSRKHDKLAFSTAFECIILQPTTPPHAATLAPRRSCAIMSMYCWKQMSAS